MLNATSQVFSYFIPVFLSFLCQSDFLPEVIKVELW